MNPIAKRLWRILLPVLAVFLVFNVFLPTWAQSVESNSEKAELTKSIENKTNPEQADAENRPPIR